MTAHPRTGPMGWLRSLHRLPVDRPKVAVLLVVLITLLSLVSLAFNGIDRSFTVEDFMPGGEASDALEIVDDTFATTYDLALLVRYDDYATDVITQATFLDVLELERSIANDVDVTSYMLDPDDPMDGIVSPVDIIATAVLQGMDESMLSTIGIENPVPTYDNLIRVMRVTPTPYLKDALHQVLVSPMSPGSLRTGLPRLFSNDFDPVDPSPKAAGMVVALHFDMGSVVDGTPHEGEVLASELESRIAEHVIEGEGASIHLIGPETTGAAIIDTAVASMESLFPLAALVIVAIMMMVYRDLIDTAIGVAGLLIAVIWMFGFASAVGYSINPMTLAVPILVLGLGIDYSIHLIMRYREERSGRGTEEAMSNTMTAVGVALALATLTTVVAFLSNLTSPLEPLREFGVLAAVGISGSFVVMMLLVPAVRMLSDTRGVGRERRGFVLGLSWPHRHPAAVVVLVLVLTAVMGSAAVQLDTTFDVNDFLPDGSEDSLDLEFLEVDFETTDTTVELMAQGGTMGTDAIQAIQGTIDRMQDDTHLMRTGGEVEAFSLLSVMADWAHNSSDAVSGYDDPRYSPEFESLYLAGFNGTGGLLPDAGDPEIVAMVDWLEVNAPLSLSSVLVENDSGIHLLMTAPMDDTLDDDGVRMVAEEALADSIPLQDLGMTVIVTGDDIASTAILSELDRSQTMSLLVTFIVCLSVLTLVMFQRHRSVALGSLAMLPVALCVVWMWGTMELIGIPLNVMTMTIASLTVGVGVTFGIHVTHRFVGELENGATVHQATHRASSSTGASIIGAGVTTMAGFALLALSDIPPVQQFGGITAIAILYSMLAAVIVLPSFLSIWARFAR